VPPARIRCAERLELQALPGLPVLGAGDDLPAILAAGLERADIELRDGDVLVIASKAVSRCEGRFVDLATVLVSERARELAVETGKDPRMVELTLREAQQISRVAKGALVVRHRLGFISADAGIDCSNAAPRGAPAGSGPWALLLPEAPDASAERLRGALEARSGAALGVVISDSLGRPFRLGTVGAAIGVAGLPPLWDRRGEADLFGRVLEHTVTALADQVAAAADLVAGQAAEGRAAIHVRGLSFPAGEHSAAELARPPGQDLYA
jgi:coenzyme F420-0:L-glutamate ligase/coenzyme F420-1:gamma-L-glutamate ligase